MSFIKAKTWSGRNLSGLWHVTRKLDGVRALVVDGKVVSRNGRPLYGLEHLSHLFSDAEVFCGSFKQTIEQVRSHDGRVEPEQIYHLLPLDPRLSLETLHNPTAEQIKTCFERESALGHEGLILRQGNVWLKVKGKETWDVEILEILEGQGKHLGRMGALVTPHGNVGTGFSDEERGFFWQNRPNLIGQLIEVECMEMTVENKFRLPRFLRIRWDK